MFIHVRSVLAVLQVTLGGGRDGDLLRQRWPYIAQADVAAEGPRGLRRLLRWVRAAPVWFGAALRGPWARAVSAPASTTRWRRRVGTGTGSRRTTGDRVAASSGGGVRRRLARRRSAGGPDHGKSVAV
jgi:hypothetical protein